MTRRALWSTAASARRVLAAAPSSSSSFTSFSSARRSATTGAGAGRGGFLPVVGAFSADRTPTRARAASASASASSRALFQPTASTANRSSSSAAATAALAAPSPHAASGLRSSPSAYRHGAWARSALRMASTTTPRSMSTGVLEDRHHHNHHPDDGDELDAALEDILGGRAMRARPIGEEEEVDVGAGDLDGGVDWTSKDASVRELLSTVHPRWTSPPYSLDRSAIDALSARGITHFTPVQAEAFGPVLARRDVIGRSRTGTGKTLAFGLPSLARLVEWTEANGKRDPQTGRMARGRSPSMLVLCPTRELARQVSDELSGVAKPLGFYVDVFHGGVSYDPQSRALRGGVDVVVGTPGRIIDHIDRGNLDLTRCDVVVLDEADEMLNMGFADDVETILEDIGSANKDKTQCLLFSATTPNWVQDIGRKYQEDVVRIDSTSEEGGARVAKTVRHLAVQLPPGAGAKKSVLEDIIAVEISKDAVHDDHNGGGDGGNGTSASLASSNPIAHEAAEKKRRSAHAMQQKIFGKTIVFTETKREADELVSGGVFKSLTAQALHGDVGQKQRDATLNAFRAGAFNVLVATDVAARGIDIRDVDLVVQFDPPRDADTYVHRSGRTGRAGRKGISVLLFSPQQARDIVKIEKDLGHGFQFDLVGPPSIEAAMRAAARTSAIASKGIPDETAEHFKESAAALLDDGDGDPVDVVARCLAAISRRSTEHQSRSLITGEAGFATVEMVNTRGRNVAANDVMFAVSKLSRMSQRDEALSFDNDVGKIQANPETGAVVFDMSVDDAKRLVEFSAAIDTDGNEFSLLKELEVERGRHFGREHERGGRFGGRDRKFGGYGRGGGGGGGGEIRSRYGGGGGYARGGGGSGGDYRRSDRRNTGSSYGGRGGGGGGGGSGYEGRGGRDRAEFRGRYDSRPDGRRGGGGGGGGAGASGGW